MKPERSPSNNSFASQVHSITEDHTRTAAKQAQVYLKMITLLILQSADKAALIYSAAAQKVLCPVLGLNE